MEGVREGERKVRGMERHSREPQRSRVTGHRHTLPLASN